MSDNQEVFMRRIACSFLVIAACGGGKVSVNANVGTTTTASSAEPTPPAPVPPSDKDGDGIADAEDKCPDKAGPKESGGCPEEVKLEGTHLTIAHKIMFNPNEHALTADDGPILDAIATFLKSDAGKTVELVEIAGHADHQGDEGANTKLTANRAKSVVEGLVSRGVEAKRLNAVGYGEYCPIEKAETPEAREHNRRVEFQVLKISGKPTGVALGCEAAAKKGIKSTAVK